MPAWVFASLRLRNASKLWLTVSTLLSKSMSRHDRAQISPRRSPIVMARK